MKNYRLLEQYKLYLKKIWPVHFIVAWIPSLFGLLILMTKPNIWFVALIFVGVTFLGVAICISIRLYIKKQIQKIGDEKGDSCDENGL